MSKTTKSKTIPYDKIQYVFNNLTKDELNTFDKSEHCKPDLDTLMSNLHRLIESGFKLSAKWDSYSGNGIQLSAVCNETGKPSSGYATSARSNDLYDALAILLYKIQVLADNDLSSFDNEWKEYRG